MENEKELRDWAREIQERERIVAEKEAAQSKCDTRIDSLFDAINRKHFDSLTVIVEPQQCGPVRHEPTRNDPTVMLLTASSMVLSVVTMLALIYAFFA